jgi:hypothetical protein
MRYRRFTHFNLNVSDAELYDGGAYLRSSLSKIFYSMPQNNTFQKSGERIE